MIRSDTGQPFAVYRETTIATSNPGTSSGSAVLVFRFRLWFMPDVIAPLVTRVFESLSIITLPFIAGLPEFQTKLWLFDHSTGDYEGIYHWESVDAASRYARTLRPVMLLFSSRQSIEYEILGDTDFESYLEDRVDGASDRGYRSAQHQE